MCTSTEPNIILSENVKLTMCSESRFLRHTRTNVARDSQNFQGVHI